MYLLINLFNFYFLKIFFILFHNCFLPSYAFFKDSSIQNHKVISTNANRIVLKKLAKTDITHKLSSEF